jgi:hypothetical protein
MQIKPNYILTFFIVLISVFLEIPNYFKRILGTCLFLPGVLHLWQELSRGGRPTLFYLLTYFCVVELENNKYALVF